jgi:hypothetical protein
MSRVVGGNALRSGSLGVRSKTVSWEVVFIPPPDPHQAISPVRRDTAPILTGP